MGRRPQNLWKRAKVFQTTVKEQKERDSLKLQASSSPFDTGENVRTNDRVSNLYAT